MKLKCAVIFVVLAVQLRAESATPILTGIVNLPEMKFALLEIGVGRGKAELILGEGQRDGGMEVIDVRPNEGRVKVKMKDDADARWLSLDLGTNPLSGAPSIVLRNAGLVPVLYTYARCAQRSLLQHPQLPRETKFSLSGQSGNAADARKLLEGALAEKQIATIPDGDRFIMVVPKSEVSRVKPNAPKGNSPPAPAVQPPPTSVPENEILPAGMVDLRGTLDVQVILLYADLIRKKLDPNETFRSSGMPGISFTSVTPLTRAETVYAIETLLAWRNVKVVPTKDDLVKAVRTDQQ